MVLVEGSSSFTALRLGTEAGDPVAIQQESGRIGAGYGRGDGPPPDRNAQMREANSTFLQIQSKAQTTSCTPQVDLFFFQYLRLSIVSALEKPAKFARFPCFVDARQHRRILPRSFCGLSRYLQACQTLLTSFYIYIYRQRRTPGVSQRVTERTFELSPAPTRLVRYTVQ